MALHCTVPPFEDLGIRIDVPFAWQHRVTIGDHCPWQGELNLAACAHRHRPCHPHHSSIIFCIDTIVHSTVQFIDISDFSYPYHES